MEIQISNKSGRVIYELLQGKLPEGIKIEKVIPPPLQCDISIDWTTLIVSLAASVPVGVFINWLSQYLIDKPSTKITIDRKEIYYDEGEVTRMLEEIIVIEQGKINKE